MFGEVTNCAKESGDDLSKLKESWELFIGFADQILEILQSLKERFPECGTAELYDTPLDYRNAANERKHGSVSIQILG